MTIEELVLFIVIKHPNPHNNPREFIASLPDDLIATFYPDRPELTLDDRRRWAATWIVVSPTGVPEILALLSDYYVRNQEDDINE